MTDFGRRVAAAAVANVLPKTGQTDPYCNYDDGYYEKGWTDTERFTDNGDGTVTDNATGLMWPKDLAGAGVFGVAGMAWLDAIVAAEGSGFAGHDDWRLPNILELESVISYGAYEPSIYAIFDNATSVYAWTGTTNPADDVTAFSFDLNSGGRKAWNKTWVIAMALPVRTA